ncbi:hypothetical protein [Sanguibacter suaedae]|uniref:DUF8175 domain-containing protein n=1 Tax=Sanguibacter suaedae TaxID=2795737 RepID=A0A934I5M2_9MICO|nr:hypothetical protein [Sanguibacter suaedae]MBI9114691.1 hypothetical protein [Sanguibacter suaedae]
MADEMTEKNPHYRPSFVVAAVTVIALIVAGVVVVANMATRGADTAEPATTTTTSDRAAPTVNPSAGTDVAEDASVCGLDGEELEGTLTAAPDAEWHYQGTTAYPTSEEFGPADSAENGIRTCFQRSPSGALFMSANAITQGSDAATSMEWADYVLAEGKYRDQLTAEMGPAEGSEGRTKLVGFRVLKYDGDSARIDLAITTSSGGRAIFASGVYELVWQDGDWKLSTDVEEPLNVAQIPDMSGYVPWGE